MSNDSSLTPARPKLSKRASSSASFYGQLKTLQSPSVGSPAPAEKDEIVTDPRTGQRVRIANSGIVHTLAPSSAAQKLVATVFALTGSTVSDLAIFEFTQLVDRLIIPYESEARPFTTKVLATTDAGPSVVEVKLSMPSLLPLADLRRHEQLAEFETARGVSVVLQANDVFRRHRRLVVFDMDSTLIQQEVIDELAAFVGVADKVAAITARAMNGEIDFTESLRQRVALLKGVPGDVWDRLKTEGKITFTPGARELAKALKRLGCKMAVISGGFRPLAEWVKETLGLDCAWANELVERDGSLTGELVEGVEIVNAERKEKLLVEMAKQEGISMKQTMALGDGANDLLMMKRAGLGVAFNAKPHVQAEAPCRINSGSLQDVLYLLGFTKEEQEELLTEDQP